MTLRRKLLLAQAPLALALLVAGLVFVLTVAELGRFGSALLKDNYRSVLAAQRMKESIERIDRAALFIALGEHAKGSAQAAANREPFEAELRAEEENITESGEREAAARVRAAWVAYWTRFDTFARAAETDLPSQYFSQMEPAFLDVKHFADEVLNMNQDAMARRSHRAARQASSTTHLVTTLTALALLAGILSSAWLTSRILRRLDSLGSAVRQIASGDLAARAVVAGEDEIAELAREFNTMTEHLAQYRQSSLGALLQAQQASQAAIDSLPDAVLVLDIESMLTEANGAARRLLRLDKLRRDQDPIGASPPDLRSVIERVRDHVLAGKGAYAPKGFEEAVRLSHGDGDLYLLPRATPIYGEEHAVEGVTIILQDISKLRRYDELRDHLVATVAHEFRTPLTSLQMAIHLCVEEAAGPLTERQADLLYAARDDCQRLQTIVDELLNLARLQSGAFQLKKESHAPRSLVGDVLSAFEMALSQKSIEVVVEDEPDLPEVVVDLERTKIVISNLLANAIRHSPEHSTITVSLRRAASRVHFGVADRGPGIPAEHRERIFERFYRVPGGPSGGAGLGLSIAREIVQAHGGTIGVDTREGGGSIFWFTI